MQALAADALVNVTAWALWDTRTGEPAPGSRVVEAKRILDDALATPAGREHPGVLHLYLHTMEMSATPQDALPAADLLRGLVPDAGHLQHMPSHIDVLCGDYRNSVVSNLTAVQADRRFVEREGPLNFYSLYRAHNLHFVVYSAMFEGNSRDRAAGRRRTRRTAHPRTAGDRVAADGGLAGSVRAVADSRAGPVRPMGRPDRRSPFPTTSTCTARPRPPSTTAAESRTQRRANCRRRTPSGRRSPPPTTASRTSRYLFNNTARDILAIAAEMLDGEIAYREGQFDDAFAHLRRAIELDDALPYDEPWGWMQPTRHAYGALLLEQGRVEEAAEVYAADLGLDPTLSRPCQHPGNVWSLHGYHECLQRLGRTAEAAIIGQQLALAMARADVPIAASCACRLEVGRAVSLTGQAGASCNSIGLPSGSVIWTCLPPGPTLISLRNVTPALRRRSTSASRSST